jgi:hypothetical protein
MPLLLLDALLQLLLVSVLVLQNSCEAAAVLRSWHSVAAALGPAAAGAVLLQ